uniref:Transcription elongation regulator 1-like protein n=1 Tax=Ficedula albicollis TaxID=59894 RepID=A0A803W3V8_FICAL
MGAAAGQTPRGSPGSASSFCELCVFSFPSSASSSSQALHPLLPKLCIPPSPGAASLFSRLLISLPWALHPSFPGFYISLPRGAASPLPKLSIPPSQALYPPSQFLHPPSLDSPSPFPSSAPPSRCSAPLGFGRGSSSGSGNVRRGFLREEMGQLPEGLGVSLAGLGSLRRGWGPSGGAGVPQVGLGSPQDALSAAAAGTGAMLRARSGSRGSVAAERSVNIYKDESFEPCHWNQRWIFGAHSPVVGFSPSSSVELVPLFPPAYTAAVPPHAGKGWVDKRLPSCKIYLSNAFALDSAWVQPEEPRLFQGAEKPLLLSNQVAMAVARPAAASRPLPTLLLAPQLIPGGCQNSLKAMGGTQSLALVSLEPEPPQGPQPCHLLTLSPIKVPLLASPFPGKVLLCLGCSGCWHSLGTAGVKSGGSGELWGRSLGWCVRSCFVAWSRCVVWTGDDRVFFFNPTMQLSVWERPLDLRHRGDIKRLLEDPPHKRKLEAAASNQTNQPKPDQTSPNQTKPTQTKPNQTKPPCQPAGPAEEQQAGEEGSAPRISPPLEERITHFRDMLLERGVSAFSTWEKELHKIVFDPRYLLLNPEERRQIFEQFVKTRVREEYKEKKNKLLLAKEEFKKLLEESKLSPRTTFKEFAEKHGRDQRFRLVQKKKDQEHFFNQFILILKKRDKENRIRLRKMR